MLITTRLGECFENDTVTITFEGSREDIQELRDYARIINSVKRKDDKDYYYGFEKKNDCEINYGAGDEEVNKVASIETEEDFVNHPSHYTSSGMECIDEMILLYGEEEVMSFCKLNAHKYRKRALDKGGKQDMEKSDWYLAKYKELQDIVNKHDAMQYRTFLNDMEILLKQGACLDIDNENFIRLYENFLV